MLLFQELLALSGKAQNPIFLMISGGMRAPQRTLGETATMRLSPFWSPA
jgi:hypothetical protein